MDKLQEKGQKKLLKLFKEINKKNQDKIDKKVKNVVKLKGVKLTEISTREDQQFEVELHESTGNFHQTTEHVLKVMNDWQDAYPFLDLHMGKGNESRKVIIRVFWGDYLTVVAPLSSAPPRLHSSSQITESFDEIKQENARRIHETLKTILDSAAENRTKEFSTMEVKLKAKTMTTPATRQHFNQLRRSIQNQYSYVEVYRIKLNTIIIRVRWSLYFQYVQEAEVQSQSSSSATYSSYEAPMPTSKSSKKSLVKKAMSAAPWTAKKSEVMTDAYAMKQAPPVLPTAYETATPYEAVTPPTVYPPTSVGRVAYPQVGATYPSIPHDDLSYPQIPTDRLVDLPAPQPERVPEYS